MLHMKQAMERVDDKPTDAMIMGTHIHAAVLEPEKLEDVVVYPGKVRRGKEWDAFKAEHDIRNILYLHSIDDLNAIRDAVQGNKEAKMLLEEIEAEKELYWDGLYSKAKAKLDGINPNFILEVKSMAAIHPRDFQRQSYNMGYHLQYGWYQEAAEMCQLGKLPVYIIAIESRKPFDCVVYEADEELIAAGRIEAVEIAKRYNCCRIADYYPGVAEDGIQTLKLPEWTKPKEKDISNGTMEVNEL